MPHNKIKLAINGAAGRMGQRLIDLADADDRFNLLCAIESTGHPYIGKTVAGVSYTDSLDSEADVVIDFSQPEGTQRILASAINSSTSMVIGTTGLSTQLQAQIDEAAKEISVFQAANFSVGINLLLKLAAQTAEVLGDSYDIEIVEAHHRFKQDAPSGTALAIAKSICDAKQWDMQAALKHGREGNDPRQTGQIGMHAVRIGDTVGEHSAMFGCIGETITLSHSAHSRDTFASGALRAASWLCGQPAGSYTMTDVLG